MNDDALKTFAEVSDEAREAMKTVAAQFGVSVDVVAERWAIAANALKDDVDDLDLLLDEMSDPCPSCLKFSTLALHECRGDCSCPCA